MSLYRYSKLAHGYLGSIDRTESGKQCVPWNSPVFVQFYALRASYFPDKEIPGAVCRNPLEKGLDTLGLKHKGPWCFTNYIEEANFMESCDLPLRGQLKSSCNGIWITCTYTLVSIINIFMGTFVKLSRTL